MWITVEHDGKQRRIAVAKTSKGVWVGWPGGAIFIGRQHAFASEGCGDEDVTAPMTGKVVQVRVAVGDAVQAEDVLVVLEAMKMEYRLTAPRPGVVEAVLCEEGELVDLGATLVTLSA